jgi:hypothetical protein
MESNMKSFEDFLVEQDTKALAKKYKVDPEQLKMGVKVEKEHDGPMGKDTDVVGKKSDIVKIAVAHLREDPKYYTKLKKVED